MTGTAVNASDGNIYIGQPIGEDEFGNAVPVDANHPAIGICTNGGSSGQIVSYTTDGFVDLNDWTRGFGTKTLIPGKIYSANGQQIGTASNRTKLRVAIASTALTNRSELFPITTPPMPQLGKVGDFAVMGRQFFQKLASGWSPIGILSS